MAIYSTPRSRDKVLHRSKRSHKRVRRGPRCLWCQERTVAMLVDSGRYGCEAPYHWSRRFCGIDCAGRWAGLATVGYRCCGSDIAAEAAAHGWYRDGDYCPGCYSTQLSIPIAWGCEQLARYERTPSILDECRMRDTGDGDK